MANLDITQTSTTDMTTRVTDYSVSQKQLDQVSGEGETYWDFSKASQNFGYYKTIPELKKAIDALAVWTAGKGYKTDAPTQVLLEHIDGWGEDTFQSIMENMIITKKIIGDAFAEIIKEGDKIVNLKPLNPTDIRIVCNKQGRIIRYEQKQKTGTSKKFKPEEILHLCNDRLADEIHGTSVIDACEWVILARNEAMSDFRRILHRSTIRIMEVDEDDTTKLNNIKRDYADAIKNGELLLIPKGTVMPPQDLSAPNTQHLEQIRYLENFFYQAVGIPKIILGGSEEFTEASSKIGYLTFEQVYMREQRELEGDLWNQLYLRIEFERPVSLKESMQESENKNTGQVGFQPNDTIIGRGKA